MNRLLLVLACSVAFLATSAASAGVKVVRLKATVAPCAVRTPDRNNQGIHSGTYAIVVQDSSRTRYFAFSGKGVDRSTTRRFVGTRTWTVHLAKGIYRFRCGSGSILQGTLRILS